MLSDRVEAGGVWEVVFSRDNVVKALQRVERNNGAAGVDGTAGHFMAGIA